MLSYSQYNQSQPSVYNVDKIREQINQPSDSTQRPKVINATVKDIDDTKTSSQSQPKQKRASYFFKEHVRELRQKWEKEREHHRVKGQVNFDISTVHHSLFTKRSHNKPVKDPFKLRNANQHVAKPHHKYRSFTQKIVRPEHKVIEQKPKEPKPNFTQNQMKRIRAFKKEHGFIR